MRFLVAFLILVGLLSCQGPEPRKPVKVNSGSSFKASIERTKALLAKEDKIIQGIIAKDSTKTYLQSSTGSYYYYNVKDENSETKVAPNDLVTLTYNVVNFSDDTIYRMKDIGIKKFVASQLDLFPGLRNSVPLLKENETATFLFPSSLAYGYHGDNGKIGANTPLKSTLTILKVEKRKDSI